MGIRAEVSGFQAGWVRVVGPCLFSGLGERISCGSNFCIVEISDRAKNHYRRLLATVHNP